MAFDLSAATWSAEILELAELEIERLSDVRPAGSVVGEVPANIAAGLGLAPGAIAVTGAHDQPSGALGCGAIAEGISMDSTGTVECVAVASSELILDDILLDSNLPVAHHAAPRTLSPRWDGRQPAGPCCDGTVQLRASGSGGG